MAKEKKYTRVINIPDELHKEVKIEAANQVARGEDSNISKLGTEALKIGMNVIKNRKLKK